jgi:5'-phosphate synthase pdxT subunit
MNDNLHRLQAACLTGGYIVRVRSLREAQTAQERGAVGVFLDPNAPWQAVEVTNMLQALSIHVMCALELREALDETFANDTSTSRAGVFTIAEDWQDLDLEQDPVLPVASGSEQIHQAISSGAALIILNDPATWDSFHRKQQENQDLCTTYFAQADDIDQALAALEHGLDGLLLNFLPDYGQISSLRKTLLKTSTVPEPHPGRLLVGVISLQGDYLLQKRLLKETLSASYAAYLSNVQVETIRTAGGLHRCDALLLPGGWSNLQSRLMDEAGLTPVILEARRKNKPILAVCAGMVLAGARPGEGCEDRRMLGLIDVRIDNNILNGRKRVHLLGESSFEALFSNGPIAADLGPGVRAIARLDDNRVVAASQENVSISAYHEGPGVHDQFLAQCVGLLEEKGIERG